MASASAAERVSLIIGNSVYKYLPALKSPGLDARAVSAAFEGIGFRSEIVADADAAAFASALRDFSNRAARADEAVVYFAGYCSEVAKVGYLLPIDVDAAALRDPTAAALPSMETVLAAFGGSRGVKIVVVDAVRADVNVAVADAGGTRPASAGAVRGLGRLASPDATPREPDSDAGPDKGGLIVYSTLDSPLATPAGANSPFAASLLRHLAEPDTAVMELFRKVNDDVTAATHNQQKLHIFDFLAGPHRLGQ